MKGFIQLRWALYEMFSGWTWNAAVVGMPISSASSLHFFSNLNGKMKCTRSTPSNAFAMRFFSNLANFTWFFAETSVTRGT